MKCPRVRRVEQEAAVRKLLAGVHATGLDGVGTPGGPLSVHPSSPAAALGAVSTEEKLPSQPQPETGYDWEYMSFAETLTEPEARQEASPVLSGLIREETGSRAEAIAALRPPAAPRLPGTARSQRPPAPLAPNPQESGKAGEISESSRWPGSAWCPGTQSWACVLREFAGPEAWPLS